VLVADRRISEKRAGKFHVANEEWTKAFTLVTDDARVAVGLCGLARAGPLSTRQGMPPPTGGFDTGVWLMDALLECGQSDRRLVPTLESLRDKATSDIGALTLPASSRRLTVVFSGSVYSERPQPCFFNLTNFDRMGQWPNDEPFDQFELDVYGGSDSGVPVLFAAFGGDGVVPEAEGARVLELLRERRPMEAYVEKGIDLVEQAAANPASGGRIGDQISSLVIPADPQANIRSTIGHPLSRTPSGSPAVCCRQAMVRWRWVRSSTQHSKMWTRKIRLAQTPSAFPSGRSWGGTRDAGAEVGRSSSGATVPRHTT